jgi:hypothetical protein
VGQEREGHAEDVHVLGREEAIVIQVVARAAEPPPHHLLAQELGRERAQPHDVRHRLRVPALREHAHGDHVLDLRAGLPGLAHRVHLLAQTLGLLVLGELLARRAVVVVRVVLLDARLGQRRRLLLLLGRREHPRVDVEQPLAVAELFDQDVPPLEGRADARRRLRAVRDRDHDRRCRGALLAPQVGRLQPVAAQQVVGVRHEARQRLVGLGLPAEVVPHLGIAVDVEELGAEAPGVR